MRREKRRATVPMERRIQMCSSEKCLRRGGRSVLLVRVCYPVMLPANGGEQLLTATDDGAERFNRCYAEAAELFLQKGLELLEPEVLTGDNGSSCLRRLLICEMTPVWKSLEASAVGESEKLDRKGKKQGFFKRSKELSNTKDYFLQVTVTRRYGYRREVLQPSAPLETHQWRFPEGTMKVFSANPSK